MKIILYFTFLLQLKQVSKSIVDGNQGGDDFDSWAKSRQLLKPDDQLDLTEAELGEEVPKMLTCENTNVQRNLVIYSFKTGGYVSVQISGNRS